MADHAPQGGVTLEPSAATQKAIRTQVPRPGSLSTSTLPPQPAAASRTIAMPRPVPLPSPLVVKNGSNIRAFVCRVHAAAGVADRQHDPAAVRGGVSIVQRAALGHGVAGVGDEVEQHLLQLAAVGQHRRQAVGQRPGATSTFGPATRRRIGSRSADGGVEVARAGRPGPGAADGQHLARQGGGAVAGLDRLVEDLAGGVVGRQARSVVSLHAEDDAEQVVEVVDHLAGDPADGGQPLRLAEVLLQPGLQLGASSARAAWACDSCADCSAACPSACCGLPGGVGRRRWAARSRPTASAGQPQHEQRQDVAHAGRRPRERGPTPTPCRVWPASSPSASSRRRPAAPAAPRRPAGPCGSGRAGGGR